MGTSGLILHWAWVQRLDKYSSSICIHKVLYELIFVGGVWVHSHSFINGYSVFPTTFIEETIFPPLSSGIPYQILDYCTCVVLFLGSWFCFTFLCDYFYAYWSTLFWLLQLCSIVWNPKVWCLQRSAFSKKEWYIIVT